MTLAEIEAFLAVEKYGTLSKAAQKLFLSQPALTRRIQTMEKELGYRVFVRQKGLRGIKLTEEGSRFAQIAWKWQRLLEETDQIRKESREMLSIAAIDSALHNMLSDLLIEFTNSGFLLQIYNAFSETAYQFMEKGLYDLAFITLQDYTQPLPRGTQIYPAYSEAFVVVSFQELPNSNGVVALRDLQENREVFCAWNKEFKAWHADHFDERIEPIVILEHYMAARYFLQNDSWMLVPYSTGTHFQKEGAYIYEPEDGPPNQITFCLSNGDRKAEAIHQFLSLLNAKIKNMPQSKIQSFLA